MSHLSYLVLVSAFAEFAICQEDGQLAKIELRHSRNSQQQKYEVARFDALQQKFDVTSWGLKNALKNSGACPAIAAAVIDFVETRVPQIFAKLQELKQTSPLRKLASDTGSPQDKLTMVVAELLTDSVEEKLNINKVSWIVEKLNKLVEAGQCHVDAAICKKDAVIGPQESGWFGNSANAEALAQLSNSEKAETTKKFNELLQPLQASVETTKSTLKSASGTIEFWENIKGAVQTVMKSFAEGGVKAMADANKQGGGQGQGQGQGGNVWGNMFNFWGGGEEQGQGVGGQGQGVGGQGQGGGQGGVQGQLNLEDPKALNEMLYGTLVPNIYKHLDDICPNARNQAAVDEAALEQAGGGGGFAGFGGGGGFGGFGGGGGGGQGQGQGQGQGPGNFLSGIALPTVPPMPTDNTDGLKSTQKNIVEELKAAVENFLMSLFKVEEQGQESALVATSQPSQMDSVKAQFQICDEKCLIYDSAYNIQARQAATETGSSASMNNVLFGVLIALGLLAIGGAVIFCFKRSKGSTRKEKDVAIENALDSASDAEE